MLFLKHWLIYNVNITEIKSDFTFETTEKLVFEYLKNNKPDCIISATDNMAFGAIKAIHTHGFNIPEDISIAGFGGYKVSEIISKLVPDWIIKFVMKKPAKRQHTVLLN